jgi:threonyl-tRNA synthetase
MQKRIRRAEKEKVPYMLILGKQEIENKTVSVRHRGNQDLGLSSVEDLAAKLRQEIEQKSL